MALPARRAGNDRLSWIIPARLQGLSLCAGAGGLELGLHIAWPGYRTVGYVERDTYAAATLVARMADQALDHAPVWSDAKTFDGRPWRGKVDILTAGYPCQPFSAAGLRRGTEDPRHLWPHVARVIREVRPRLVFCENVEGHLSLGFPQVARELQGMGFAVRAGLFSAAEAGAAHIRRRLFILANADSGDEWKPHRAPGRRPGAAADRRRQPVGHPDIDGGSEPVLDAIVADSEDAGLQGGGYAGLRLFAAAPCEYRYWEQVLARHPELQPSLFGLEHGLAHRVEQFMLAGNGVSPLAAALAFRALASGTGQG